MKVVLFFSQDRDWTPDTVPYIMYGKYSSGGILFVSDTEIEGFYTTIGGEYRRHVFTRQSGLNAQIKRDFLLLSVNEEEKRKLYATCEACVEARKPFNLIDIFLMYVPFREPDDPSVFSAKTLNNTQAIISILRECLDPSNPLCRGLDGLHSRLTFMDVLYEHIQAYAMPYPLDLLKHP